MPKTTNNKSFERFKGAAERKQDTHATQAKKRKNNISLIGILWSNDRGISLTIHVNVLQLVN
jgi:hypothetical protein